MKKWSLVIFVLLVILIASVYVFVPNYVSISPMLNITTKDSINYLTRVAIPMDKELKSFDNISFKRMLGRGKILVTEIKGGTGTINNAFQQMKNYVSDYQRIAPAIPFLSLVTDRIKEPDSSKWITRIYYPVM